MLRVATLPALRTGKFGNAFWFLFIFTIVKHQSECPERHSAIWPFASQTHGITGDATSQQA